MMMDMLVKVAVIGGGATALLDLWSLARGRILGGPLPNYSLVGRWMAGLPQGRLFHAAIAASPGVKHEALIGWATHYLIGMAFAGMLLLACGDGWSRHPTLLPALTLGLGSVAAPFLLMQPGMGQGIAASRTPDPNAARLRSLTNHLVFGLGLYAAGWAAHWLGL